MDSTQVVFNTNWNATNNDTAKKLLSFLSKPAGWKNGYGGPADLEAVRQALKIIRFLRENSISRIEVFSGENGQVLVSSYKDDECLDLYINANLTFDYNLETQKAEFDEESLPFTSLNKILSGIVRRWTNSHAYCITPTTVLNKSVSKVPLSKIPQVEEFQYLKLSAPCLHPAHYKSTLQSSMPKFRDCSKFCVSVDI